MNLNLILGEARKREENLPLRLVGKLLAVLVGGLAELHREKAFLGELTPHHLLFDGDRFMLLDTTLNTDLRQSLLFEDCYLEPALMECMAKNRTQVEGYNPYAADVWALGLILFEALTLFRPEHLFEGTTFQLARLEALLPGVRQRYGDWAGWVLRQTLESDANQRILAIELQDEMARIRVSIARQLSEYR